MGSCTITHRSVTSPSRCFVFFHGATHRCVVYPKVVCDRFHGVVARKIGELGWAELAKPNISRLAVATQLPYPRSTCCRWASLTAFNPYMHCPVLTPARGGWCRGRQKTGALPFFRRLEVPEGAIQGDIVDNLQPGPDQQRGRQRQPLH